MLREHGTPQQGPACQACQPCTQPRQQLLAVSPSPHTPAQQHQAGKQPQGKLRQPRQLTASLVTCTQQLWHSMTARHLWRVGDCGASTQKERSASTEHKALLAAMVNSIRRPSGDACSTVAKWFCFKFLLHSSAGLVHARAGLHAGWPEAVQQRHTGCWVAGSALAVAQALQLVANWGNGSR